VRVLVAVGTVAIVLGLVAPTIAVAETSDAASTQDRGASASRPSHPTAEGVLATAARDTAPKAVELIVTPRGTDGLTLYPVAGADAPSGTLPPVNELGSPLVVLAVARTSGWLQVLLPTRPNGSTAWVRTADVKTTVPEMRVELSFDRHELRVLRTADGAELMTAPVGFGSPSSPTPGGRFFVRDHFPTEGGDHPYGPFAFGLSGHSDVHMQFGTGDGRIAIHGTNQPSSVGVNVSNGCPHVTNDVVLALVPLMPLGTPVVIA
jgi:lipoprotein-anchoring transpeptidase ErfK/SrfK